MITILFDTSVLIASFIANHPKHTVAVSWLKQAKSKKFKWGISAHSIAECYAVLTRLPVSPKIVPNMAMQLLEDNLSNAEIIALSSEDYFKIIKTASQLELSGGIIYDWIIFSCAKIANAQKILTANPVDFYRLLDLQGLEVKNTLEIIAI